MSQIRNQELLDRIAIKIKRLRERKGISQEVVYIDTKIHIGRIESGKSNLTISTLDAICVYFEIDIATFMKGY